MSGSRFRSAVDSLHISRPRDRRRVTYFVIGSHTYAVGGVDIITTTIENAGETTFTASGKCTVHAPRIAPGRVATHRAKKDLVADKKLEDLVDLIFLK